MVCNILDKGDLISLRVLYIFCNGYHVTKISANMLSRKILKYSKLVFARFSSNEFHTRHFGAW